jgi:ATP-binding cassette subfamily F protein 3
MLQLTGAGKRFGPKLLFDNLDWLVTPKERAGIVGGNGTGKTTLLRVIAGIEHLDYGSVTSTKGLAIGYLPQDGLRLTGRTVFAECMTVFASVTEIEQELESLTRLMSELDPSSSICR